MRPFTGAWWARSPRGQLAGALLGFAGPLLLGAAIHTVERATGATANAFAAVAFAGAAASVWAGAVFLALRLRARRPVLAGSAGYLAVGLLNTFAWVLGAVVAGTALDRDLPLVVLVAGLAWPGHLLLAFGCNLGLADAGLWTTCAQ